MRTPPPPPPQGLSERSRRQLGRGFGWLGGASIAARAIDLGSVVAMLFLLTRRELGIGSLVVSIGMVVEAFNGLGTGDALVQAPRLARAQLDGVFCYALAASVLAASLLLLASPAIGAAYGLSGVPLLLLPIAAKQPMVAAALVPLAMLNRELAFRRIALVGLVATLGAAAIRLGLGLAGAGAWAPVAGYASSGLLILLGAQIGRPFLPRTRPRARRIARLARFGLRATLANAAEQGFKNVDFLLVGAFYGAASLGTYRVAFDVAMEPALAVGTIVARTTLPVLARESASGGDLTPILAWSLARVATLAAPLAVGLAAAAGPLCALLHDGRGRSYAQAAAPLAVLAVAALARVLFGPLSTALFGAGRPGLAAMLSGAILLALGLGVAAIGATLPVGAGLVAVSALWLAIYPVLALPALRSLGRRESVRPAPLARAVAAPLLASAVLAASVAALDRITAAFPDAVRLAAVCAATALCYLALAVRNRARIIPRRAPP